MGRRLAERLGWSLVDTGLMYRALAYLARERGVPLDREAALVRLLEEAALRTEGSSVTAHGQEIGLLLDAPGVAQAASRIAQLPRVRRAMVERQRELARGGKVVMVGRDIGTVVLPEAPVKVFLQASVDERARRRQQELVARGLPATYAEVLADLRERDRRDEERAASPLRPAPDALILQTEGLTLEEVAEAILATTPRPARPGPPASTSEPPRPSP